MSFEKLEGSFNLEDVISQLFASNLVHQTYIETIAGFIAAIDRMNRDEIYQLPPGTLFQIFQ